MLKITIPSNLNSPRQYILNVLLTEFLGIPFTTEIKNVNTIQISYENKTLTIADTFFQQAANHWLQPESLPPLPLAQWNVSEDIADVNLVENSIPVIFGDEVYLISHDNGLHLGLDIFGSAFFMLSRYEEAVKSERDIHDRFPASASLAYQAGFLHRPIVNEYLEILWVCMKQLWPSLKRKPREFQMKVSCDVDHPYQCGIKNPLRQVKHIAGDLIIRKSPKRAIKSVINYFASKRGNYSYDPYYTRFEWMMDVNEKAGNKVAFYFIAGHSEPAMDGCYSLDEPVIRKLMRRIHDRGHEIGLHASYNTYNDKDQLCREADNLRRIMKEEGIQQEILGGRQHYLRWETPTTFRNWDVAGLDYDTTLSFADHAGFRCGTCYEYPVYDVVNQQPLKLRERPLIAMEGSVIYKCYMGLGTGEKAFEAFQQMKAYCQQFNGNFTLLWHNDCLIDQAVQKLYEALINRL